MAGCKVQQSLCLIRRYAINTYSGQEVRLHTFISALDGGERSASWSSHFTLGQWFPRYAFDRTDSMQWRQ